MRWIALALVALLLAAGCSGPADPSASTTATKSSTSKSSTATASTSTSGATTTTATATTSGNETTGVVEVTGDGSGQPPPPPPPAKPTFACADGPVVEEHATHGADAALPSLAWAALKTGTRFAVVWSSASPTTASLRYSVGGGSYATLAESVPTTLHVFVLQALPQDGHLCFQAVDGSVTTAVHAARLSNAMHAYDPVARSYTTNLMVLANEAADRVEVQDAADRMAEMLWDSTDGWVRAGKVLVVFNDVQHHNVGYAPCFLVGTDTPPCVQYWDVIYTNDADPRGAASTYRKGVRDPFSAVWMNQYHQAMPGPISMDDGGAVLTHELGHYLFDMPDLYGNVALPTECYDSSTGISIMAGSRDATEFDDPLTPCSNQPAGYTTSWEFLQGEFPMIPARPAGPVQGPAGTGGAYQRIDYVAL